MAGKMKPASDLHPSKIIKLPEVALFLIISANAQDQTPKVNIVIGGDTNPVFNADQIQSNRLAGINTQKDQSIVNAIKVGQAKDLIQKPKGKPRHWLIKKLNSRSLGEDFC